MTAYLDESQWVKNGWSRWIRPVRKGYKMACCDCSLVHRMDFKTVKRGSRVIILFRCSRDNRSTAALRRRKPDNRDGAAISQPEEHGQINGAKP